MSRTRYNQSKQAFKLISYDTYANIQINLRRAAVTEQLKDIIDTTVLIPLILEYSDPKILVTSLFFSILPKDINMDVEVEEKAEAKLDYVDQVLTTGKFVHHTSFKDMRSALATTNGWAMMGRREEVFAVTSFLNCNDKPDFIFRYQLRNYGYGHLFTNTNPLIVGSDEPKQLDSHVIKISRGGEEAKTSLDQIDPKEKISSSCPMM